MIDRVVSLKFTKINPGKGLTIHLPEGEGEICSFSLYLILLDVFIST
jgi:hypothetical protein